MKENINDAPLIEQRNSNKFSEDSSDIITGQDTDFDIDIEENEKKSCFCCCCFYLFCCCFCHPNIKSNDFFQKNWKTYLDKEGSDASDLPFNKITNLFANADDETIQAMGDFRLNPNLVNENKLRNDLEFYIPQLCTFLLFGGIKAIKAYLSFLFKVCSTSFFFAHRVHWFLSAMINAAEEKKERIIEILQSLNTLFKSPYKKNRNKIEQFYIANSEDFINYIKNNNLYFLYDSNLIDEKSNIFEKINYNDLNGYQQEFFNKYKKSRDIIIDYSEKEYQKAIKADNGKQKDRKNLEKKEDNKNQIETKSTKNSINSDNSGNLDINTELKKANTLLSNINSLEYKFLPSEFFISLSCFKLNNLDLTYQEDEDSLEFDNEEEEKGTKKEKPSDILFNEEKIADDFVNVKKITKDINFISSHSTLNFIDHLCDISNDLPNYPIEEQMSFLYKKLNEINKILPCNAYLPFLKDSTRNYLICHIPLEGARIFRTKTRCPLMLTFEIVRIDEINRELKEEQENGLRINLERNKSISSNTVLLKDKIVSKDFEESKEIFTGTDYDLSKPVTLNKKKHEKKDLEKNNKKGKTKDLKNTKTTKKKKVNEENAETVEDLRIKNIIKRFKQMDDPLDKDRNVFSKTIFKPTISNTFLENSMNIGSNSVKKLLDDVPENEEEITPEKQKKIEDEIKKEEKITTKPTNINMDLLRNVFGESFSEKGKNIKKNSLFGKLDSHKIFRCIIKTHEDLRQEQFATQLINEFYQIYQLEKTGLWLNTYEIISTGNDSGLVEMVNDSLSLDQLKHKIDHISLSDFFLHYFGNGDKNSDRYKNAIKNYIASLAGYSLVCYFLQIKDRHNGNILIDNKGHLIHIDFGFLLSNAPGKRFSLEKVPFKLSKDFLDVLGGLNGKYFNEFKKMMKKGFEAINKHRHKISILVEMMWCGHGKKLDCFEKGQDAINELKARLHPKDNITSKEIERIVNDLINQSAENWRTKWYDIYQNRSNGIYF